MPMVIARSACEPGQDGVRRGPSAEFANYLGQHRATCQTLPAPPPPRCGFSQVQICPPWENLTWLARTRRDGGGGGGAVLTCLPSARVTWHSLMARWTSQLVSFRASRQVSEVAPVPSTFSMIRTWHTDTQTDTHILSLCTGPGPTAHTPEHRPAVHITQHPQLTFKNTWSLFQNKSALNSRKELILVH